MRMKKASYEVYEDNGGQLHLFVFDDNGDITFALNYYGLPSGQLADDIIALQKGDNAEDWDADNYWLNAGTTPKESLDQLRAWVDEGNGGAHLIANQNGLYPAKMGIAGLEEMSLLASHADSEEVELPAFL